MGESTWTGTGQLRWVEKKNGYRFLQQLCEREGWKPQWMPVPVVAACDICSGEGTINGGLGVPVTCSACHGEGAR